MQQTTNQWQKSTEYWKYYASIIGSLIIMIIILWSSSGFIVSGTASMCNKQSLNDKRGQNTESIMGPLIIMIMYQELFTHVKLGNDGKCKISRL